MRVIVHTTEVINHMATIEIDPEAVRAYYEGEVGVIIDGHIPDWAIKNYLRDQRPVWLEQLDDQVTKAVARSHKLDEINVIS